MFGEMSGQPRHGADRIVNGWMILLIGAVRTTFRHLFTQL